MKVKICIMSAFLSILLLFSSFPVKANEVTFPSFPLPVEGKSTTHYLIYKDKVRKEDWTYDLGYYLIQPLDPSKIDYKTPINPTEGYRIQFHGTPAIVYSWVEGETSWKKVREIGNREDYIHINTHHIEDGLAEFLYSSFDLYYTNGNLFFRRAPIKANFLHQMMGVKMGAVMTTVVSLIPLLMALLVSLIGFRKAWAWLSRVLRKA